MSGQEATWTYSREERLPLVYTVEEVAELLGRAPYVVYEMVATGRIPAIKWGPRSTMIPRQALEQYLVEEAFRQQSERAAEAGTTSGTRVAPDISVVRVPRS